MAVRKLLIFSHTTKSHCQLIVGSLVVDRHCRPSHSTDPTCLPLFAGSRAKLASDSSPGARPLSPLPSSRWRSRLAPILSSSRRSRRSSSRASASRMRTVCSSSRRRAASPAAAAKPFAKPIPTTNSFVARSTPSPPWRWRPRASRVGIWGARRGRCRWLASRRASSPRCASFLHSGARSSNGEQEPAARVSS